MSNEESSGQSDRFEVRATSDSHFGWIRTRLSVERTMMAYMRTAVSLIGFGFAIVQFFNNFQDLPGVAAPTHSGAPRLLGLALIGSGILAMVVSIWEYRWLVRYLRSGSYAKIAGLGSGMLPTPLYAIAAAIVCVGIFAFIAVLFRLA